MKFHFIHTWEKVYSYWPVDYFECKKCGCRKHKQYSKFMTRPLDAEWLSGEKNILNKFFGAHFNSKLNKWHHSRVHEEIGA